MVLLSNVTQDYLAFLTHEQGATRSTVYCYASWLHHFQRWLESQGDSNPTYSAERVSAQKESSMEPTHQYNDQQYKTIRKRWKFLNLRLYTIFVSALVGIWVLFEVCMAQFSGVSRTAHYWFLVVFVGLYLTGVFAVTIEGMKQTALKLSDEDHEKLMETAKESKNLIYRKGATQLLRASEKVHPRIEYLRPSQQTQGETLLHAATYSDTPQDQLLRPVQSQEE